MARQVQLRGGTSMEHEGFVGAPREITVDTDLNTLRVHDGETLGGHELSKKEDVDNQVEQIRQQIEDMSNNIGSSHNHDDRYANKEHNHDGAYYRQLSILLKNMCMKEKEGHWGMTDENGGDTHWVRTTTHGIIPYQSGGYSMIGTNTWRFANGYFVDLDSDNVSARSMSSNTVTAHKQILLPGGEARNQIKFANDDYISYNDNTNEFEFKSDNNVNSSRVKMGGIEIGGRRIYIGSSFPSDARVNDILIQI